MLRAYQKHIFESQLNEMLWIFEEIDKKRSIFKALKFIWRKSFYQFNS